jgi:ankyrin repeat protein
MSFFFSLFSSHGGRLITAVEKGDENEARAIIEQHKDSISNSQLNHALHISAKSGTVSIMRLLLENGADHSAPHDGKTPLFVCVSEKREDGALLLIEAGARPGHAVRVNFYLLKLICTHKSPWPTFTSLGQMKM